MPSSRLAYPEVSPPEITARRSRAFTITASSTRPSAAPIRALASSAERPARPTAARVAATAGSSGPRAVQISGSRPRPTASSAAATAHSSAAASARGSATAAASRATASKPCASDQSICEAVDGDTEPLTTTMRSARPMPATGSGSGNRPASRQCATSAYSTPCEPTTNARPAPDGQSSRPQAARLRSSTQSSVTTSIPAAIRARRAASAPSRPASSVRSISPTARFV